MTGVPIKWRFAAVIWSLVASAALALAMRVIGIPDGAKWALVVVLALFNTAVTGWMLWPLIQRSIRVERTEPDAQWVGNQNRRRRRNRRSGKR